MIKSVTVQRARRCPGLQVPRHSPRPVPCLIKLISIGPSYRESPDTLSPAQLRQHERSLQHDVHYLDLIQVRHALDNNVGDASGIRGARLRSCTLTVIQSYLPPSVTRRASKFQRFIQQELERNWPLTQCRGHSSSYFSTRLLWIEHRKKNSRVVLAPTECPTCSRWPSLRNKIKEKIFVDTS